MFTPFTSVTSIGDKTTTWITKIVVISRNILNMLIEIRWDLNEQLRNSFDSPILLFTPDNGRIFVYSPDEP